jgi:DNA-binding NarL/FixJ family response regulator
MSARKTSAAYAAAVAADVAARYGAKVNPAVVQVLPQGMVSAPTPIWCPKANQLVYPNGAEFYRNTQRFGQTRKRPNLAIAKRRERVAELHAQGLTDGEVAEALAVSQQIAIADRQFLKLVRNADRKAAIPYQEAS